MPQLSTPRTASQCHGTRGHCHPPFFFGALSAGPSFLTRNMAAGIFFCPLAGLTEGSSSASPDPVCVMQRGHNPSTLRTPVPPETSLTFLLCLSHLGPFPSWHFLLLNALRFQWGDRASQVPWKWRVGGQTKKSLMGLKAAFQPTHHSFSPQGGGRPDQGPESAFCSAPF